MEQRLEHRFDVSAERFWRTYLLDEAYGRALYDHLRLKIAHKAVRQQGEGPDLVISRELHLLPDRDVPSALAKLLKGATLVKEQGHFDARARRFEVNVELPVIGRLVDFTGRYSWSDGLSEGFVRVWEGHCVARVPLVGRALERYFLGEVETSLAEAHAFTNSWFRSLLQSA